MDADASNIEAEHSNGVNAQPQQPAVVDTTLTAQVVETTVNEDDVVMKESSADINNVMSEKAAVDTASKANEDVITTEPAADISAMSEKASSAETANEDEEEDAAPKTLDITTSAGMKEPGNNNLDCVPDPAGDSAAKSNVALEQDTHDEINDNEDGTRDQTQNEGDKHDSINEMIKDDRKDDVEEEMNEDNDRKQDTNNKDEDEEEANVRRTKRRRSSIIASRYSPGEGGGLKRHKSSDNSSGIKEDPHHETSASSSQIVLNAEEGGEKINVKKKETKKKAAVKTNDTTQQYPIYQWVDEPVTKSSTKIIHNSFSINFGPLVEDTPIVDSDGSWKCLKCYHTNIPNKMRCGLCLSWKGGKRENYSNKSKGTDTSNTGTGDKPLIISVGDDVLVSSGDAPWKDLNRLVARAGVLESDTRSDDKKEMSICYDDPVSSEPGLAVLDPYVAKVVGIWEETDGRKVSTKSSLESRMMIQTRWYFKKEDMEGLKLTLDGEDMSDSIFAEMSVRDLVLSNQTDLNSVSCILGKTNIVCLESDSTQKIKGGFVCRYKMNLDDEGNGTLFSILDSAELRSELKQEGQDGSDATLSGGEETFTRTEVSSMSVYGTTLSPRRVISEGPTIGKIKVGPDHQAVIPEQLDLEKKISSRHLTHPPLDRTPIMVWNPSLDGGNAAEDFIAKACSILSKSMKQAPFHELNCAESPDPKAEAKKPREISIDNLLTEFHDCKYNCEAALNKVAAQPQKFLILWNQEERDQFDSNFRVYRDSLRMIANNLSDVKSCKDTVEYYYRWKLVENFRRFKAKKEEQAREMMETVEYRMLKERQAIEARNEENSDDDMDENQMSSDEDGCNSGVLQDVSSNKDGPVNSRIRTWFKTGCSKTGSEGAVQQRRNRACSFLIEVKDQVGVDAYIALAKCLKSIDSQSYSSLVDLRAAAKVIMKSHPSLFDEFVEFLPKIDSL